MLSNEEQALVAGGNASSDAYDNDGLGGNWYGYGTYGGGGGGSGGNGSGFWYWTFNASTPTYYDSTGAIVVTASSGYWSYLDFSNGYSGAGIGGGGSTADTTTHPVANATPCVETTFTSGADLQAANNAALEASNAIAALNDETYEYSSIVWQMNGTIGWTAPYTDHLDYQVNWMGGLSQVPDGAVILGIVHNHPDDPYVNDYIPSGGGQDGVDWQHYNDLVNWNSEHDAEHDLPRGITVDPNMLLWIYSNEDHKTHVYDNTDKSQTMASCSLQ